MKPEFAIVGSKEDLIYWELMLVFLGYEKPDEWWNNEKVSAYGFEMIKAYNDGMVTYFDNKSGFKYDQLKFFKADQESEILKFIHNV